MALISSASGAPSIGHIDRERAHVQPGHPHSVRVHLADLDGADREGLALIATRRVGLTEVDERTVALPADSDRVTVQFDTPHDAPDAGVLLEVRLQRGDRTLDHAWAVLTIARRIEDDLRYGFYTNWDQLGHDYAAKARMLNEAYLNGIEFYDYFPAHGHYAPSDPNYAYEPFGISILGEDVRRKIESSATRNIVSIAYVAAYAASESVYRAHPYPMTTREGTPRIFNGHVKDERTADENDEDKWFWLMAIGPGTPWRAHIMEEFARALDDDPGDLFSFDGFEIDSYGHGADDRYYDRELSESHGELLSEVLTEFVGAVRERCRQVKPDAIVSFNCVSEFGIEPMKAVTDFLFIENWAFHKGRYGEVIDLCHEHRAARRQRVVLKMYPADAKQDPPVWTARHLAQLLGATIAGGGSLMVAGEPDERAGRMHGLNTLYYPDNLPMRSDAYEVLVAYNRFDALLFGLNHGREVRNVDAQHEAEGVQARAFDAPRFGVRTLMLLNVDGDARWDARPKPAEAKRGLRVTLDIPADAKVREVFYASPDAADWATPRPIKHTVQGGRVTAIVPELRTLGAVLVKLEE